MSGKKNWYIVDGYRPPVHAGEVTDYEGHEAIMILNCSKNDAQCTIDVFYMDRDPDLGIKYTAPAQRISAFRTNDEAVFGNVKLEVCQQYSLRITSNEDIIVQYGRLDINQPNMAYLATLGYAE